MNGSVVPNGDPGPLGTEGSRAGRWARAHWVRLVGRVMRDHRRRTEIRLIVLHEETRAVEDARYRLSDVTDDEQRRVAELELVHHVQRFLYFSDLPKEFQAANPAVPWRRLK